MKENSKYQALRQLKGQAAIEMAGGDGRILLCPDMGGRIFAEMRGKSMHRLNLELAAAPTTGFNNFGGNVLWPAPEGGPFAFNYDGDTWRVQDCINLQPFEVVHTRPSNAAIKKTVRLVNRAGVTIEVVMRREASLSIMPKILAGFHTQSLFSYTVRDSFKPAEPVSTENALLAAWSLEQFEATERTVSFVSVANPREAINEDFYGPIGERIHHLEKGFLYRTDGARRGQIGVKASSDAAFIGFFDLSRALLCVRENRSRGGLYFNIADNDQPRGPYSAADHFSIFNSDTDMRAFELETIGGAEVRDGRIEGSTLLSTTTFAIMDTRRELERFLAKFAGTLSG